MQRKVARLEYKLETAELIIDVKNVHPPLGIKLPTAEPGKPTWTWVAEDLSLRTGLRRACKVLAWRGRRSTGAGVRPSRPYKAPEGPRGRLAPTGRESWRSSSASASSTRRPRPW